MDVHIDIYSMVALIDPPSRCSRRTSAYGRTRFEPGGDWVSGA